MADWYGSSRSSYFKVKDVEEFKDFLSKWGAEFISKETEQTCNGCIKCLKGEQNNRCRHYLKRYAGECKGLSRKQTLVGLTGDFTSNGGLPSYCEDEDTGKAYEFDDFVKELSTHLEDGWIAIMMEVGAEKLRYLTGLSFAVNSKGDVERVSIDDIYEKVWKRLWGEWTRCEY